MSSKQPNEDRVLLAERMVDELRGSLSIAGIARATGVNSLTVSKIANGDSKRITDKVFSAIQSYYNGFKSGTAPTASIERKKPGRKPKSAVTNAVKIAKEDKALEFPPNDTSAGFVSLEAVQIEISMLEKRLGILKQIADLAKEL